MAGRPKGSENRDKPYREALRLELAAAGEGMKALRRVAAAHIAKAAEGDMAAVRELADRLDGKVAQSVDMTVRKQIAKELSDDELAGIATGSGEGVAEPSLDPSQLN